MARARNLKPSFFMNDVLAARPALTRLLFAGLWTLADRDGRLEDRPARIKAGVLAYDDCDADAMLQDLHDHGFIARYEVNTVKFIQVLAFNKHQNPHSKEAPSTIPAPCLHGASPVLVSPPPKAAPEPAAEFPERAGLIPDSGFPRLGSGEVSPPPTDVGGGHEPPSLPEAKTTTATPKPETAPSAAVWLAYSIAYEERYHTAPVRNATVNGQLRNLVARLGAEEAPLVAAFYVASQDPLFVKAKHGVGVLLNQCEAIRTTWATRGRSNVTSLSAVGQRSADNLQHWVNDGEPSNGTQGP